MELERDASAGCSLKRAVTDGVAFMVRQGMINHTIRNGCSWHKDAHERVTTLPSFSNLIEDIKQLPSFKQLGADLEPLEKNCVKDAA